MRSTGESRPALISEDRTRADCCQGSERGGVIYRFVRLAEREPHMPGNAAAVNVLPARTADRCLDRDVGSVLHAAHGRAAGSVSRKLPSRTGARIETHCVGY